MPDDSHRRRQGEEDYNGRGRKPCPECQGSGKTHDPHGHEQACWRCDGKTTVPEDDSKHDPIGGNS